MFLAKIGWLTPNYALCPGIDMSQEDDQRKYYFTQAKAVITAAKCSAKLYLKGILNRAWVVEETVGITPRWNGFLGVLSLSEYPRLAIKMKVKPVLMCCVTWLTITTESDCTTTTASERRQPQKQWQREMREKPYNRVHFRLPDQYAPKKGGEVRMLVPYRHR